MNEEEHPKMVWPHKRMKNRVYEMLCVSETEVWSRRGKVLGRWRDWVGERHWQMGRVCVILRGCSIVQWFSTCFVTCTLSPYIRIYFPLPLSKFICLKKCISNNMYIILPMCEIPPWLRTTSIVKVHLAAVMHCRPLQIKIWMILRECLPLCFHLPDRAVAGGDRVPAADPSMCGTVILLQRQSHPLTPPPTGRRVGTPH